MSTCRETTIPRRTEVSPLFVSSKLGEVAGVAGVAMAILTTHLATGFGYWVTGLPWVTHIFFVTSNPGQEGCRDVRSGVLACDIQ